MSSQIPLSPALIAALRHRLGDEGVIEDPLRAAPYMAEERGLYPGQGQLVVRPKDAEQVAAAVALCREHGACVVPQSGNTGTVGGASPRHGGEVLLTLERLNTIHEVDAEERRIVAGAGCRLAHVQEKAREAGCFFPLSLASEQACRIGGNLATNAGGLNVLRYGNARALALGLEVVLADGQIWRDLRGLRKDNSGYDLRDLFIGSEGGLGIITAATLRLLPPPRNRCVAWIALNHLGNALPLVRAAEAQSGDAVVAAEIMSAEAVAMGQNRPETPANPLPGHPWYLLLELATPDPRAHLEDALAGALEDQERAAEVADALLAPSAEAARRMWQLRTAIPEGQKHAGASIKHDISVRPRDLARFVDRALNAATTIEPRVRPCIFGHVGDGNLHFNLAQPEAVAPQAFLDQWATLNRAIHEQVDSFGGSIAAEHGVGQLKRDELKLWGDPTGLDLMHAIKQTLDPAGTLNPGKGPAG